MDQHRNNADYADAFSARPHARPHTLNLPTEETPP
jgi:hypothetical protein